MIYRLLSIPAGAFLIFCGIWLRKKKIPFRFEEKTVGNITIKPESGTELLKRGNFAALLGYYFDFAAIILGIFCILLGVLWIMEHFSATERLSYVIVCGGGVLFCSLGAAVSVFGTLTGGRNNRELLPGRVAGTYQHSRTSKSYRVNIRYSLFGEEKTHRARVNYKKNKLPEIGSEYELIYLRKQHRVTSRKEIKQCRVNAFVFINLCLVFLFLTFYFDG